MTLNRTLCLTTALLGIVSFADPASAQIYGFDISTAPNCSPFYNGPVTPGGTLFWGWQDTTGNGSPNSCVVRSSDFQQYGYADNGVPNCSPNYDGPESVDGDGDVYGWEDTDFDGAENSCFVTGPATTVGHQYGFAANGTPNCSSGYTGSETTGSDGNVYGWQDTDNDGEYNSCFVEVASPPPPPPPGHQFGIHDSGQPICSPNYSGSSTAGGDGLDYGWEDTDNNGQDNSCIIVGGQSGGGSNPPPSGQLTHFGQPITLVGANVAWEDFGSDVGDYSSTADRMRNHFREIKQAGGNSARWWLHASGWFTPEINYDGSVVGISTRTSDGITDDMVIGQVREILDAAWDEGIVLNISLFSFEMVCTDPVSRGDRFDKMLNTYPDTYIDNVLTPLVTGLKDHPALFSWEIFNEADGMTQGTDFFNDHCSTGALPQPLSTLQRFVNKSAAKIRELDPNVKVTTSVSQTMRIDQYTNNTLTSLPGADPDGILDYYQAHWYWMFDHGSNPYFVSPADRNLDRPLVLGEFSYETEPASGTPNSELAKALLDNGHAGAWIWDQTSLGYSQVATVISGASSYSPPIDKAAVELCIATQDPTCYETGGSSGTTQPPAGGGVTTFNGTADDDVFSSGLTGESDFFGNGGYDQIDYEGRLSDYDFQEQTNGQVWAIKTNGDYDILDSIEGLWFIGEGEWYSVTDAVSGGTSGGTSTLVAADVDFFAFAGQSNAEGHFYNADGNNSLPTGSQAFESRVQSQSGFATTAIEVATGSSASNEHATDQGLYWWDLDNNLPGPLLNVAVNDIGQAIGSGDLDGIIWSQGETDAYAIFYSSTSYSTTVERDYQDATQAIFSHFRSVYGNDLPIFIQEISDFVAPNDATSSVNGFDIVRNVQEDIAQAQTLTHMGARTIGLGLRDDVHYDTPAYNTIAEDLADTAVSMITSGL